MKLSLYGPVQLDCVNDYWQVIGPKGSVKATFVFKKDAITYIKENN